MRLWVRPFPPALPTLGLIPGGTYVLYDDGCDVLLTATRDGLSIDSDSAKDWNDNAPTEATTNQVTSYRALMIAGPSEKGQALAAKVNAGEDLTWEDVSGVNWSVMGSSSPAGYIYPSLWLQEQFDKNITELPHAVQSDSYGSAFARLASGQIDVLCTYADARRDYADKWTSEYAMTNSIWEDTAVIGVTPAIYNDTISVSKSSPIMDDDFKAALSQAFINIGDTDVTGQILDLKSKGAECMVVWASDAEYVLTARQAYELGLQVPTVASPAITMDQVRDLCEPEWVEGWYSVTDFVGNSDDPEVTAFCDKYASDYGEGQKAELYVADVYSTFKLVFDAIERAGSADRQAIRDAVAETKDFPMLQGNATCDENNLLVHSATVALIKDNVPVMYTTVSAE